MSGNLLTLATVEESDETPALASPRPGGFLRTIGVWLRFVGRGIASASDWLFGGLALTVGLAVIASIPGIQLLSFGYLLEAAGRVARTGRIRDGFVGIRKASRVGSLAIGIGLFLLPLELISSLAESAELVDPGGKAARRWAAILVISTLLVIFHVAGASVRGGRVRHFLMPFGNPLWIVKRLRQGDTYVATRDVVWEFVASLHLPYYFRLGCLGFLGTMTWLAIPVSLLALGRRYPPIGLLGAFGLGVVAMPLPFLQTRFAVSGRFRDMFAWRGVRERFTRAPWAFAFTLLLTLTFALPLYLLKIEIIPRETAWLPGLVFTGFIFPARVLTGWAYGRSLRREAARHGLWRWTGRMALLPIAAFYVLVVFLSQYTAWRGVWSLYEQHAFLMPVPFLGL